ncbi:LacI family transcriptional regulator [Caldicoprobacter algeriensis]|uniref:LacI family DNA-binding transcriptional regulator n=1 Tax=Caldicoprobacter algeriensis TaxID=699281 RepID=UPI00207AFE1D|nr:LacI family DNA-binding transcriptional regulator [Caldicoprobacter algeriensis]MCM8900110.1 LacI family transcriptional regulator [Caldicoprobacter algeriensis]
MSPTIIDIAKMANTSKSTVSRYLNGGKVRASTAKRIEEAIRKLKYKPNVNARRLVLNKTNVIGVVVDDISNIYYSGVLAGIQAVASQYGYVCTFYSRAAYKKDEKDYLDLFKEGQVDGLILGTFQIRDPEEMEHIAESGYPIIFIGDNASNSAVSSIDIDNVQGVIDIIKYLHSLGHKRIAHLRGPSNMSAANLRLEGFVKGMKSCGLEPDPELIIESDWTVEGGYTATNKLLDRAKFTALVCSNDYCANGAIKAIQSRGLRVPEDISVTGFDNSILAEYTSPPITTVKQPFYDLGKIAVKHLVDIMEGDIPLKTAILLQPIMVIRSSCGKAPW